MVQLHQNFLNIPKIILCHSHLKKANKLLGCIRQSVARRSGEMVCRCRVQCWAPQCKKLRDILEIVQQNIGVPGCRDQRLREPLCPGQVGVLVAVWGFITSGVKF